MDLMYPIEQANDQVRVREILLPMSDGTKLYTRISMPAVGDKFPIVYIRTPYEKSHEGTPHDLSSCAADSCIKHGYAVVWQHCRGEGDSEGFCIPYGEKSAPTGWTRWNISAI
jgi:predicted acyl esterase